MLTKLEEITLIAKCVTADDRHAFGRLVDEYNTPLRRFLFNLTGDAQTAEDLAQETFIKAYTSLRSFKGISRFKTWLFTIAYREFANWHRNNDITCDIESATDIPSTISSPETDAETHYDVSAALATLNDTERTLVLLFYIEDMPIKKISSITAMPVGTIKVYLKRARERMAKSLQI